MRGLGIGHTLRGLLGLALGLVLPLAAQAEDHAAGAEDFDGEALYQQYCALCHGTDREGYAADHAPSLRSPELLGRASGRFLWYAIAYGRPGTPMAAFAESQGGPLSHDAQHALLDWLVTTSGVTRDPVEDRVVTGDVDRGRALYQTHCASCHGARGEGGTAPALGHPVTLATASDAFLRETVAKGRTGTPMKAYQDTLSERDLDALTAFLRSRAAGWTAPDRVSATPPDPARAVQNPAGATPRLEHREGRFVSADSVARAMASGARMVLLDARPISDWYRGHIPGALPMPYYDGVETLLPHLPRDGTPIIAYCACPHAASGKVVDALVDAGFAQARILDEGVLEWAARGHPMVTGRPDTAPAPVPSPSRESTP